MNKVWVLVAAAALAAAPGALAAGSCAGDACAAIAAGAACTITNNGDKSVQLTTVADQASLMMTVLAPGETIKQDKALCEKFARGEASYDARFATLRTMPEAPAFSLKPKGAKPAVPAKPITVAAVAPAPSVAAQPTAAIAPAGPALPRAKPAPPPVYPPIPRSKPELPAVAAAVPAPAPVASVTPVAAVAPTAAVSPASPPTECGEACATILFKVVDSCLWVVNMHPRPIAFEAEADGKRLALTLEAADGEKADTRAKSPTPKDEAAVHMRLHDPFQSAGSGIPIYRARLGAANTCVKERSNVTRFSARFVN